MAPIVAAAAPPPPMPTKKAAVSKATSVFYHYFDEKIKFQFNLHRNDLFFNSIRPNTASKLAAASGTMSAAAMAQVYFQFKYCFF